MGNAVLVNPETPFESRGLDKKQTWWERLRKGDEVAHLITLAGGWSILVITGLLVQHLWVFSRLSRHAFGWHFLVDSTWDPVNGHFGAWPFVYGTVVTSLLALAISIPIGIGSAIFLAELAPRKLSNGLTFLIELLAAVPSVIYGLIGIFLLTPFLFTVVPYFQKFFGWIPIFGGTFYGVSYFSASVVLSIMVVPFIISISREVLIAVPVSQREAMMALGATKWDVTWRAVVPYARQGIMGSIFLSLARALGETMAVTMVIGNVVQVSTSLMAPGYTIAAVIANEFTEATGDLYLHALIELGLVLFVVTMIFNALARLLMLTMKGHEVVG
ncbi:MAG TPA: phosphate ABC transporter permease subunit PstC [Acidobacteriaceae bacterium]|nr:phosphate ABC transporter permease subunit PstC [Acidobacteriaceae bacterium]